MGTQMDRVLTAVMEWQLPSILKTIITHATIQ